jgi:hypothetical protein
MTSVPLPSFELAGKMAKHQQERFGGAEARPPGSSLQGNHQGMDPFPTKLQLKLVKGVDPVSGKTLYTNELISEREALPSTGDEP